jgi:hypothetical protein
MIKRIRAARVNARAQALQKHGKVAEAIEQYEKAAAIDPRWSVPLYNLGLLFKNIRQWKQSLDHNQRATALDPKNMPAWWSLGIAATALGRWQDARRAWRGYGISVPDGDGPIDLPCGACPIRLDPNGQAEVVWAQRIDPARAELASIPFPESGHRWRDIVLNDGAPNGYRKFQGAEVPVFDALDRLEASPYETYVARVGLPGRGEDMVRLTEIAEKEGCVAEDWSTSVRLLRSTWKALRIL